MLCTGNVSACGFILVAARVPKNTFAEKTGSVKEFLSNKILIILNFR